MSVADVDMGGKYVRLKNNSDTVRRHHDVAFILASRISFTSCVKTDEFKCLRTTVVTS